MFWAIFNKYGVLHFTISYRRVDAIDKAFEGGLPSQQFVAKKDRTKADRDRMWRFLKKRGAYAAKCEVVEV